MSPQEREYYRERARVERSKSTRAENKKAAEIHLKLACLYQQLVDSVGAEEEPDEPTIVTSFEPE